MTKNHVAHLNLVVSFPQEITAWLSAPGVHKRDGVERANSKPVS